MKFLIIEEGVAPGDKFLIATDETVAAVVLILFRQQRQRRKQLEEDPHRMAIRGSDLFRVIVLRGVFVPGTAAVQRTRWMHRAGPKRRIRNGKNTLGPFRAHTTVFSRTPGSIVHLFLT